MSTKSNAPEKKNESPFCFLLIVKENSIKEQMMELPQEFVDKHGRRLSGIATFYAAGEPWEVVVLKSEAGVLGTREIQTRICFSDGLPKFLQHYSIETNNLIFFKYKGDSEFDVVAIDQDSGCSEITPPEYRMCFLREVSDEKMTFPLGFVNKYGRELSLYATLNVANGEKWPLSLTKSAAGVLGEPNKIRMSISIKEGLKERLQQYSIKLGNHILFKYKGESEFDVDIIDQKSNCEINYGKKEAGSLKSCEDRESKIGPEAENPKRYVEEIINVYDDDDDDSESHGSEAGSPKHSMKIDKVEDDESNNHGPGNEEKFSKLLSEYPNIIVTTKFATSVPPEAQSRVVSFVRMLKPQRPCFLAYLYPSTVPKGLLVIGEKFVYKYLNEADEVKFEVANVDDEIWSIGICTNNRGVCFKKGWSKFTKENDLVGEEILIFELISGDDVSSIVLKVHIDRVKPSGKSWGASGSRRVRMKNDSTMKS